MAKDASIKKRFQMPRGTACKVCRKRKVKCDAVRPQCTRCIQALEIHARFPNEPLPEPCQYDPPRSYSGIGGRKKANVLASSEASTSTSAAPRQKRSEIRSTEALSAKEEQFEDIMDGIETESQNTEQAIRSAATDSIEPRSSSTNRNQDSKSSPISVEVIKKLVDLFFEHCLISSIVDRFSVEEVIANKGGPDSMSLLRAILSHSVFYCSQEEASQSLWTGEEASSSSAQELSLIHSMAAKKGMSSSLKSEDEELESSLPIYLLLVSSGIKSSSQQVLSDLSFASLSIKRLGFWALPRLSSLQIPAISNPSISSAHNKMRNSLFWFFIILDRQVQVKFSIPPFLSDCVRQTPLPFEDREKSMSIVDSTVLNPSPQQESWTLLIQSMILIGKTVSRKPTTDGLSPLLSTLSSLHGQSSLENDTSLVSLQSRIQIKSGKVREVSIRLEKGKSASSSSDYDPIHSSRIRLLTSGTILRTCELIIQEADALLPNDVSLARARSTSQDAARIVKEGSPVEIRFVDPILANCWFITARFLIRQISANQVLASEMKEVENGLLDLLLALSRWGDIYPSGKLLSKSLLALLRLSLNRKLGFVLPPSHFAPEAKLLIAEEDRSSTWGETKERYTSLQELAGQIDNEELDRFILDGRVR